MFSWGRNRAMTPETIWPQLSGRRKSRALQRQASCAMRSCRVLTGREAENEAGVASVTAHALSSGHAGSSRYRCERLHRCAAQGLGLAPGIL